MVIVFMAMIQDEKGHMAKPGNSGNSRYFNPIYDMRKSSQIIT
jgi:hypothetical protein